MRQTLIVQRMRRDQDFVRARQIARDVARLLGFDTQGQTRLATAVSEITRNAKLYAGTGDVEFSVELGGHPTLWIRVIDDGPGIEHFDSVLDGSYRPASGIARGIVAARRLVEHFRIESRPVRGTEVHLGQSLPSGAPPISADDCAKIAQSLAATVADDPLEEVQRQNQELLATLDELRRRQFELDRLNAELQDTNRGVLALYAELDDKAESLRRASESKTRFLSNMTHEFRTPLNSILSLTRMLLERTDGDLTTEQQRQVSYIKRSAEDLSTLVNDLLDLAKVEAGRLDVRATDFEVADLFSGLKGALKPLLASASVALTFEEPAGIPTLHTDEGKLSQILRNFISNALKFTEAGEIRVSAAYDGRGAVTFSVRDTGIGVAQEDQQWIFLEFTQIEGPHQKRAKGTGLGLPLSAKLAELLGGSVAVESDIGVGSTFSVTVPATYAVADAATEAAASADAATSRATVLAIDESSDVLDEYEMHLRGAGFRLVRARTLEQARAAITAANPTVIVMDVLLENESAWSLLADLRASSVTRAIPVVVATRVENREKAMAAGAAAFALKPVDTSWLVNRVIALARGDAPHRVLVVDDDEVARYILKGLLDDTDLVLFEASSGSEGLQQARRSRPDAIFLDLDMPDMRGEEVLAQLKADAATRAIPVILYTSERPDGARRESLLSGAVAIVEKNASSREVAIATIRGALERAGVTVASRGKGIARA